MCLCGSGIDNQKLCDIGPGDQEWIDTKERFLDYISITRYCHPARGLSECGQKEAYMKWY